MTRFQVKAILSSGNNSSVQTVSHIMKLPMPSSSALASARERIGRSYPKMKIQHVIIIHQQTLHRYE